MKDFHDMKKAFFLGLFRAEEITQKTVKQDKLNHYTLKVHRF